jgi:hypothetical protein
MRAEAWSFFCKKQENAHFRKFRPRNPTNLTNSLGHVHSIEAEKKTRKTAFAQGG